MGKQLEIELKLYAPVSSHSDSTMRDHLMFADPNHVWLKPFEMTPYEEYIMAVFWQLHRDREYSSMDGSPKGLKLQTFVFYSQLFNDELEPEEIEAIQSIDLAYLIAKSELRKGLE